MDHSLGDDLFQPYKKYIAELLQSQHNDQMISQVSTSVNWLFVGGTAQYEN